MNRSLYGFAFATIIALVSWGCAPSDSAAPATDGDAGSDTSASTEAHPEHATLLCGLCGQEKGSDSCCDENAEVCDCGMAKGSALCCKELPTDAAGKDICTGCGHAVADGEHHHCDPDCEACEKCGLHAGSPACCKLETAAAAN